MIKPQGWDDTPAVEYNEKPSAGGYILGCINVEPVILEDQKEALLLKFDIAEGEFKNYYRDLGTRLNIDLYLRKYQIKSDIGRFKGLINSFEKSNPGYKWNWDEKTLKRLRIGASLQMQSYTSKNGQEREALKILYLCSRQSVESGQVKAVIMSARTNVTSSNNNNCNSFDQRPQLQHENQNERPYDHTNVIQYNNDDDLPF